MQQYNFFKSKAKCKSVLYKKISTKPEIMKLHEGQNQNISLKTNVHLEIKRHHSKMQRFILKLSELCILY